MIFAAAKQWGRIDVLVNNAGVFGTGPIDTITETMWDHIISVNLKRAAVVNASSIVGISGYHYCGAYGPSNGGVIAFTQQLAMEWAQYGIRVNAIAPELIATGMIREVYADPELTRQRAAIVPLGRIGQPEDIAKSIAFLASSDADYITGQVLTVDGGLIESSLLRIVR